MLNWDDPSLTSLRFLYLVLCSIFSPHSFINIETSCISSSIVKRCTSASSENVTENFRFYMPEFGYLQWVLQKVFFFVFAWKASSSWASSSHMYVCIFLIYHEQFFIARPVVPSCPLYHLRPCYVTPLTHYINERQWHGINLQPWTAPVRFNRIDNKVPLLPGIWYLKVPRCLLFHR